MGFKVERFSATGVGMKVLCENLKRKKQKLWNKIQKIHQRFGVESESKAA